PRLGDQIKELHRVFERQQPPVVHVGRRLLDPPQRERLDRAVGGGHHAIDYSWLIKTLRLQIVHGVVGIVRRWMTQPALCLAEKQSLPAQFHLRSASRIQHAVNAKLGRRWKIQQFFNLSHQGDLTSPIQMAGGNSGMMWSGRSKSRSKRVRSRPSCFLISSIWYFGNSIPPSGWFGWGKGRKPAGNRFRSLISSGLNFESWSQVMLPASLTRTPCCTD